MVKGVVNKNAGCDQNLIQSAEFGEEHVFFPRFCVTGFLCLGEAGPRKTNPCCRCMFKGNIII